MLGGNSSTSAKALRMSATYRGTNGIGRGDVVLSRNRAYQVHSSGRASNFDHLYLLLTFEFYDLHDARCKPEAFGKLFCVRMCVWNTKVVPPARFQRATSRLGGERSMQLSYGSTGGES
jgi:hypothetical protein